MSKYREITQPETITQIRPKYQADINWLRMKGFDKVFFVEEGAGAFSCVIYFPLIPYILFQGELFRCRWPLRLSLLYPVLLDSDGSTGVKLSMMSGPSFFTPFQDGSWVVSVRSPSLSYRGLGTHVYQFDHPATKSIREMWQSHTEKVAELVAAGQQFKPDFQLQDYIAMSQHLDATSTTASRGCRLVFLFVIMTLLSLAVLRLILALWPSLPVAWQLLVVLVAFFAPYIVVRWYQHRLEA